VYPPNIANYGFPEFNSNEGINVPAKNDLCSGTDGYVSGLS
jgi:hypothetical protein